MKIRTCLVMATIATVALASHAAVAAAATPLLIEQTQAQLLPAGSITDEHQMSETRPFTTGTEHYTRTIACRARPYTYVAKCLSLEQSPPPAGSTAVYDPEHWALTSPGEHRDWCAGMRLASQLIRADHATPMISVPKMTERANVACAARNARQIIFQLQPNEADTPLYMHLLRQATRWARAARPNVRVAFVLSTNAKYGAAPADLAADYQQAEAYLGGAAAWWLNIIPDTIDPSRPVVVVGTLLETISA